jgi:hypothetical protein
MEHLCTDCKHCKRHWLFGMHFATCESPQNKRTELVTGRKTYKFSKHADVQRTGDVGDCSDAGRWFEPKERRTIWMRVFGA